MQRSLLNLAIVGISFGLVACGSDDDSTAQDERSIIDTSTYAAIDATQGRAYLDLESGHSVTSEDQWHMSYQKYVGFSINGGISGERGVSACVANVPEGIYDAEGAPVQAAFESLTRENTLAGFNSVTIESCDEFEEDSLKLQIQMEDWLEADYSQGAPVYSASEADTNGWIIQSASKNEAEAYEYGRVHVNSVAYVSGEKRALTLAVEAWDSNAEAFSESVNSPELDFTDSRVYWDLETNSVVTSEDNWELSIVSNGYSWDIQVNGGASGDGSAAVGTLLVDSAYDVTSPAPGLSGDVYKYYADSASSILSGPGNYGALHYGVDDSHNMWPNFTTYLFKDGDRYYKAQVVSNYGEDGTLSSGNLYIRYAEVLQ